MAISAGCPSGVGPEVTLAALRHREVRRRLTPLVFGDASLSDHLPRGQWWAILGDPELHALEEQVAAANQNLKIAEARLRKYTPR